MTQGVYFIKNTINGKIYIGSSRDVEARIKSHFSDMKCGRASSKLQIDYERLGIESFECGLLEEILDENELLEKEELHIASNDSIKRGYNTRFPVPRGTFVVNVNFTENQYRKLERLSKNEGKSIPSWILNLVKEKTED